MTIDFYINNILTYIKSQQQAQGNFLSFSFSTHSATEKTLENTFCTSLILGCLQHVGTNPKIKEIIDPAVNFLLSQKNSDWSWNYYPVHQSDTEKNQKNSAENKSSPYPNDWDDTACALIAISLYRKELLTPEVFGTITKLLVTTESKPGGPYYTWILNEQTKEWKDIDPVVNANIGYFLKLHNISLPPLEKYIEDIITDSNYTSRYYHIPESIIYFISRYYSGPLSKNLTDYLLKRQDKNGLWENDLITALAVSSFIRANVNPNLFNKAIDHLKEIAIKNDWQTYPLYIESHKETTLYNRAPALTAAFVLETLSLWDKRQNNTKQQSFEKQNTYPCKLHEEIMTTVKKRLALFPEKTTHATISLLTKMLAKDPENQITLLPYFFSQTLASKKSLSQKFLQTLGEANLYGWLAYTIYDNILDHDSGPELLPIANTCLRELVTIYTEILPPDGLQFFQDLINKMEQANAWEDIHNKITKVKITKRNILEYPNNLLSDKSLPHAFGPISILLKIGYNLDTPEIQHIVSFFKNYLAARQLNDDAHDWQEDLNKGFLNSVSFSLVHRHFENNPKISSISFTQQKSELQALFYKTEIIHTGEKIHTYIQKAQADLDQLEHLEVIKDRKYFEKLLTPLQQSSQEITSHQKEIGAFLASFQS